MGLRMRAVAVSTVLVGTAVLSAPAATAATYPACPVGWYQGSAGYVMPSVDVGHLVDANHNNMLCYKVNRGLSRQTAPQGFNTMTVIDDNVGAR